ncbi:MAG: dihydroorotate dehydrogenase electron transfer subunit [Anaerolineae bacterium]|nr:dihydroorotate dehydrogenase electron transfer subunit [Anaerolineae bacterium]
MKRATLPHAFRIVETRAENEYTKTFVLAGALEASPGQFVMAWLPEFEDKPFSLANADPLSLTIAAVGPFTQALHQLRDGDLLWVRGPLGQGYQLPTGAQKQLLLIGGGYGVAPLLFLAKRALAGGHRLSMIIGARTSADLLLIAEFEALGIPVWLTTEDGSAGRRGVATDAMSLAIDDIRQSLVMVYACGPTGMLQAVVAACEPHDLPVQLAWEAHMRCGIGLCGSCEVGQGWLTCLDGPVFAFSPTQTPPPELTGNNH